MSSAEPATWFLLALAILVVSVLALWAHVRFWQRRLGTSMPYAHEERIPTEDGSAIELRRVPGGADDGRPPVLLVHGLGANHRNQDLLPDRSLARHLAEGGRDVWLLTLRSGVVGSAPRHVRFDKMLEHDVPLGVRRVLEHTKSSQVDYVGFSMGGMLLYAALANTVAPEQVRRAVIIGSPAIVRAPVRLWLPRWVARFPAFLVPTLRLSLLAKLTAFASEWFVTPIHRLVMNPDNVSPGTAKASMVDLVADVAGPLNMDFAGWALSGGALTVAGRPVLEALGAVRVPALFFAGAADRLAPPDSVRAAFEAWGKGGSCSKRFVLLGRDSGARADYGHGDLAIGTHARSEVYEPIERFLNDDESAELG